MRTYRDCHGLLYPAGYSRRVQQGTGTGWVYPTLALPVPPAGGWRVGGRSAHSNSARKACQRSTQTTSDASYVGKFSYLFLIFLPTTRAHEGPQRPMKANTGQRKPTAANDSQRRPTQVNKGQRRPMKAHSSQRRPTKANAVRFSAFSFIFYSLFLLLRDSAHPTPRLQIRAGGGFTHHHQPPTITTTTTSPPPAANDGQQRLTTANKG